VKLQSTVGKAGTADEMKSVALQMPTDMRTQASLVGTLHKIHPSELFRDMKNVLYEKGAAQGKGDMLAHRSGVDDNGGFNPISTSVDKCHDASLSLGLSEHPRTRFKS